MRGELGATTDDVTGSAVAVKQVVSQAVHRMVEETEKGWARSMRPASF
ncbi:MAG: hypothetical protein IMX04_08520 [Candidatus Carbobacillus altaicus]|nr:hypothetical protein [Candidatus Carbobacillus altaicus]